MLTGAGFTKNFGGWLASEMNAEIAKRVLTSCEDQQRAVKLHQAFCRGNYENVYARLCNEDSSLQPFLSKQIEDSFTEMHRDIKTVLLPDIAKTASYQTNLFKFVSQIKDCCQMPFFWFTLNHDLLMEKFFNDPENQLPSPIPLTDGLNLLNNGRILAYGSERDITTAEFPEFKSLNDELSSFYIKLHGSINWKSGDSRFPIILGSRKYRQISSQPFLRKQFDFFKQRVQETDILIVWGYGFRDDHINKIIFKCSRDSCHFILWTPSTCGIPSSALGKLKSRPSRIIRRSFRDVCQEYPVASKRFEVIELIDSIWSS